MTKSNLKLSRMVASMLLSSAASTSFAVLRDHGPSDPVVGYPLWYRDNADLALQKCTFDDDAGNGPLCLTTTADATPGRFAGNIGAEAFYTAFSKIIPLNGGAFDFGAALEMAYATADGEPPAVRVATSPQEIVFSRIRIRVDVPTGCGGHWIVRHPYGVNEFDTEEGGRAINFTDDVTPIPGDYAAALGGHQGPFLTWDSDLPITVGARQYIGDPNIDHTYTGSAITAPLDVTSRNGLPEGARQNFIEIEAPPGCDLDGDNFLFDNTAALSGSKWTQAIPTPTRIEKATYTKTNVGRTALDVWAASAPGQNLVLTAPDQSAPSVPGIKMKENTTPAGTYYAHLEWSGSNLPAAMTVTNLTSNPAIQATAGVKDAIDVTKAIYDPVSHVLCVSAHSGDESSPVPVSLVAPSYGSFGPPTLNCPGVAPNDVVLEKDLDDFLPAERISPPTDVFVRSDLGGSETKGVISEVRASDVDVTVGAADDDVTGVPGTGSTSLNLGANDSAPASSRIVVISQPQTQIPDPNNPGAMMTVPSGTVTAPASGGTVTYTAAEGLQAHDTFFYYAIQETTPGSKNVSNVARVNLGVSFAAAPPDGVGDNFAVLRTNTAGFTKNVLSNDALGAGGFPIDPATLQIGTNGSRGVATANANGTVTYIPNVGVAAGPDSFTYTVANSAGSRSAAVTVSVVVQNAAETLTVTRARFSNPRWDIRFSTNWFGAPLTATGTCKLTTNSAGVAVAYSSAPTIGSAAVDATGAMQIQATAGGGVPSVTGNAWRITCKTSNTTGTGVVSGAR